MYKKVDLSSTQGALCTVSVFFLILYFTYLGGGCVRTQLRTPLPAGLQYEIRSSSADTCIGGTMLSGRLAVFTRPRCPAVIIIIIIIITRSSSSSSSGSTMRQVVPRRLGRDDDAASDRRRRSEPALPTAPPPTLSRGICCLCDRHGTGSSGHRVNGSFGSYFTSGSPGHHFDPV